MNDTHPSITIVDPPPDSELPQCCLKVPRATSELETRILCWMADQTSGDILELGCHTGITTAELAYHCFPRKVIAVDYLGPHLSVVGEQEREVPTPETLCKFARHFENVELVVAQSDTVALHRYQIGLAFVDADHSYSSVSCDSERLFDYFDRTRLDSPVAICWHDYLDAPWCGVKKYLDECSDYRTLFRFRGTHLVYWKSPTC